MSDIDNDWIFDSVINFVKSPLWKVPITSFINENCIIFDDEEENKLEYTDIHKKFKVIVEEMLTNMLKEIGISEDLFAEACIKSATNPVHKMLLSELMAVENFLAFKKLMVKRNRELSEETLQLMNATEAGIDPNMIYQQMNYGGGPSEDDEIARAIRASLEVNQTKGASSPETEEEEMMRKVLEESKREYEMLQAARRAELELEESKVAKQESKPKESKPKESKPKPKAEPEAPQLKAPKTLAPLTGATGKASIAAGFELPKHEEKPAKAEYKTEPVASPEKKPEPAAAKKPSATDMKERLEKLRQQRDILLQKKQEALQKEWDEFGDKDGSDESKKSMVQKGLESLNIKDSGIKFQTENQKKQELERHKEAKKYAAFA